MQKRFTYFVPRDYAWKMLLNENPSVYKKLFMPENAYIVSSISSLWKVLHKIIFFLITFVKCFIKQARQILERHLIASDKAYTMEDLRKEANSNYNLSIKLPTVRDVSMYIKVQDTKEGIFIYSIYQIYKIKLNIGYYKILFHSLKLKN